MGLVSHDLIELKIGNVIGHVNITLELASFMLEIPNVDVYATRYMLYATSIFDWMFITRVKSTTS